ncbi:MAG TPA: DUF5723 family protein [Bacteroidales bacterium]|nr:DUF5723 family protein [Bacteroidales bacterium]
MKKLNLITTLLFSSVILIFTTGLKAQNERSLFFLDDIPQSRYMNPGHLPDNNFYLGIPVLSSVKFGIENTFHYDDIFQKRGDSIYLDRDYMLGNLKDKNSINVDGTIEIISFGFRVDENYFSFRIADNTEVNTTITGETLRFLVYGNGSEEFIGKTVSLSNNAINMNYFREYTLGYTRKIGNKLGIGLNAKLLQGIANFSTTDLRFDLQTDTTNFALGVTSNIDLNMSAPGIENDAEAADFLPNGNNPGFAFDFGAEMQINEKLNVSAGVLNVGYINWDTNLKNFRSEDPNSTFVFEGFDLDEYIENNEINNERINEVLDSIAEEIGVTETALKYRTPLPAWLNLNMNYKIAPQDHLGVLLRNRFLKNQNYTTLTLSYKHNFNDLLQLLVSNTFAKANYFTPGFGLTASLGSVQLFLINENFTAPMFFETAKFYSIHFGINLIFKNKEKSPELPVESAPEINSEG